MASTNPADPNATAPPGIPNIPGPTTVNYADAYSQAAGQIAPNADAAINTLAPLPGQIRTDASNIASTYTGEIPYEQNIYSDLAKNLAITYGQQQSSLVNQQQGAVGAQKASAAKAGLDSTQGYQAAMVQNINTQYNQQIQSLADQYGVQADDLQNEADKSISDLVAEAQSAIMQGDTSAAQISSQIVGYKLQEQQMITDAANNILTANTNAEKAYWQQTYQSAILDVRQQALYLQAQKAGYDVPVSDFGGGAPAPKKAGSSAAGGKINVSTLTSYGNNLGLSSSDIQGAIDYGTQNGWSQNQIESAMLSASNQGSGGGGSAPAPSGGGINVGSVLGTIGNDVSSAWNWVQQNL